MLDKFVMEVHNNDDTSRRFQSGLAPSDRTTPSEFGLSDSMTAWPCTGVLITGSVCKCTAPALPNEFPCSSVDVTIVLLPLWYSAASTSSCYEGPFPILIVA